MHRLIKTEFPGLDSRTVEVGGPGDSGASGEAGKRVIRVWQSRGETSYRTHTHTHVRSHARTHTRHTQGLGTGGTRSGREGSASIAGSLSTRRIETRSTSSTTSPNSWGDALFHTHTHTHVGHLYIERYQFSTVFVCLCVCLCVKGEKLCVPVCWDEGPKSYHYSTLHCLQVSHELKFVIIISVYVCVFVCVYVC